MFLTGTFGEGLRQPVKLKAVPAVRLKTGAVIPRATVLQRIVGAAGNESLGNAQDPLALKNADGRLKTMTDPYSMGVRMKFNEEAHQNPILAKGLRVRRNAFFKHGYTLELELKSKYGEDGRPLLPEEVEAELERQRSIYQMYLKVLMDWSEQPTIDCLTKMKTALIPTIVQGRTLVLVQPGISTVKPMPVPKPAVQEEEPAPGGEPDEREEEEEEQEQRPDRPPAAAPPKAPTEPVDQEVETPAEKPNLPITLKVIHTEDIGQPIVDLLEWRVVAVRLNNVMNKYMALPDEMVYIVGNDWALRKESAFYGASDWEAILTTSQAYRKVINYDMVKASVAAFLAKVLMSAEVAGMAPKDKETYLTSIMNRLLKQGTDLIVVEKGVEVKTAPVEVNKDAMQFVVDKYEELLMSAAGTTKSQTNKTEGLTRDNATIQEEIFIDYVRQPDEELVKTAFENQLFTPLLARLAGKTVDELPVKVVIVRKEEDKKGHGDVTLEEDINGEDQGQFGEDGLDAELGAGDNNMDDGRKLAPPLQRQKALQDKKRQQIQKAGNRKPFFGAMGPLSAIELDLRRQEIEATNRLAKAIEDQSKESYVDTSENT